METCTVTISKPQQSKSRAIVLKEYSRLVDGERIELCMSNRIAKGVGLTIIDADTIGEVIINNVIAGSILRVAVEGSSIIAGSIDSNCMVAPSSYDIAPGDVVDPNEFGGIEWIPGPTNLITSYNGTVSGTGGACLKILGDTTITLYDND